MVPTYRAFRLSVTCSNAVPWGHLDGFVALICSPGKYPSVAAFRNHRRNKRRTGGTATSSLCQIRVREVALCDGKQPFDTPLRN